MSDTYRPGDIAMVKWDEREEHIAVAISNGPDCRVTWISPETYRWTLMPHEVGPVLGNVADIATLGTAVVATMAELSQRLEALYTEWRSLPVYPDECGEMVLDVVHRDELLSDLRHAIDGTERPRPSRRPKRAEEAP